MKRTLIIGDIHGCHAELLDLLDRAAVTGEDTIVSVGDLVDRGPQPAEVVAWFRARPGAVVLMGNHERKHVRGVFSYSQEVTRAQMGGAYDGGVSWMRGLPYYLELPEVRVVHAAMVPGVPLAEQREEILAGTTSGEAALKQLVPEGWWHERYDDAVPVVFGHHVTGAEPLVREGKVYGIDTGCCHGLRLTALSVPDFRLHSVPSRGDHWKETAKRWQLPVLHTRPWTKMSWAKLEEELADRRRGATPETAAYLDGIARWRDALRALISRLEAQIATVAARTSDFASHPAKPLLYLHARQRLTRDAIETRCATPEATLALAAKLELAPEELPPAP